jgi:hypothetical protein
VTILAPTSSTLTKFHEKEVFSPRELAFLEGLAQNRAHAVVLKVLEPLSHDGSITRAQIAKRLSRSPSQITRWLGSPGNWTLQTLAILLGALGHIPEISSRPIDAPLRKNYRNPVVSELGLLQEDQPEQSSSAPASSTGHVRFSKFSDPKKYKPIANQPTTDMS